MDELCHEEEQMHEKECISILDNVHLIRVSTHARVKKNLFMPPRMHNLK